MLTACVKLLVSEETGKKLEQTRLAFRDACNFLVPFVREDPKKRNWQRFNLTDEQVSKRSTQFDTKVYKIYDLWKHKMVGKTSLKNKAVRKITVPSCDVVSYRLIQ